MNDNPYTPPRVVVADIEHPMPARPRMVTIAAMLCTPGANAWFQAVKMARARAI
jgi:hypothetical protein